MITYMLAAILNISQGNYVKTEIITTSELACLKEASKLMIGTQVNELCTKWKLEDNGILVKIQ